MPLENLTVDECADTICRAFGEAEGKLHWNRFCR